jgi:hypothetical protein
LPDPDPELDPEAPVPAPDEPEPEPEEPEPEPEPPDPAGVSLDAPELWPFCVDPHPAAIEAIARHKKVEHERIRFLQPLVLPNGDSEGAAFIR